MKSLVIISLLSLAMSAQADIRDSEGLTPLHRAAGSGNIQLVEKLLRDGADVFALDSKMAISVLHKAVYSGKSQVVEKILQAGASINLQSPSNGDTPLHDAIYFRQGRDLSVVETLLRYKPSLSIRNRAGLTPIGSAKVLHANDIVQLLENYERSRQSNESRQLMAAIREGKFEQVEHIARSVGKTVLSESDDQGFTPLLWASREGMVDVVKLLLELGGDPNQKDQWMGANSGHKAAFWGHAEVMELLIKGGLEINAKGDYNGYTPLHDAVAGGHIDAARVLISAGASKDIKGHDGKTPLDLATASGNPELIELFASWKIERESKTQFLLRAK